MNKITDIKELREYIESLDSVLWGRDKEMMRMIAELAYVLGQKETAIDIAERFKHDK